MTFFRILCLGITGLLTSQQAQAEPKQAPTNEVKAPSGNVAIIRQTGGNSVIRIHQSGDHNQAITSQDGEKNHADVTQTGSGNDLQVTQTGNENTLERKQTGNSRAIINQNGEITTIYEPAAPASTSP